MNNWQHSFTHSVDLIEHLKKPYLRYDDREKEATSTSFDARANLVWVGDSYGRISSYDPNFSLYSRFTAHIGGTAVRDVLTHREGVLSIGDDSLHFANRRGIALLNLTSVDVAAFDSLNAMCLGTSDQHDEVYCAGSNLASGIVRINLSRGCVGSIMSYSSKVKLLSSNNKHICIGKQSGGIDIFDPLSDSIVKSFPAHLGTISAMDTRGYNLVAVGKSRRFNSLYADPFVNVYDLRMMQQLPPVSFSKGTTMGAGGADFVQLHPLLPTVVLVASQSGSFDFVDLVNPTLRTQHVHPIQPIKDIKLSPNGDHLIFVGNDNVMTTWTRSADSTSFTSTPEIWEYPDFVDDGDVPSVSVDDYGYPLSSVGMPYYSQKLLSAWNNVVFRSPGTIPMPIDTSIQSSAKMQVSKNGSSPDVKTYALMHYDKNKFGPRNTLQPYICLRDVRKRIASGTIPDDVLRYKPLKEGEIPPAYGKLQLSHGRYGSDNFDFQAFNKTPFSTLDTDGDNTYTNAVLQLYRFVPEVFNFVVGCLKNENFESNSLLTELGYLYDMIDRSKGTVCRSTNFQSSLNSIEKAKELGLTTTFPNDLQMLERLNIAKEKISTGPERLQRSLGQKFNEFLLTRLIEEEAGRDANSMVLKELFGFQLDSIVRSSSQHYEKSTSTVLTLTLLSPARNGFKSVGKRSGNQTILPYLESSMKRVKHINNSKLETVGYERTVKNLPPILSLNILLTDSEWNIAKSNRNWLAKDFYATMSKDKALLQPTLKDLKGNSPIFKYELNGYVAKVTDNNCESRLVTYARKYDRASDQFKWYMFNGYLAIEIEEEEALDISYWWKTPEMIIYCDAEEIRKPFFSVDTYPINCDILYRDHFANKLKESAKLEYKLLTKEEAPQPGSLVAIDAEFVILNEEMSDIDCHGVKTIVKPKKTALARLSAIRCADGPLFGVPFIDDYIFNEGPIENYVTKYSGISPGDLDLKTSSKPLVSREVTYRKVWLLMQIGCVFVGHGLSNDFKHININVPAAQIRDTALYFLRGKRYLSLRYLAFALLDRNIQEGNHDSIEDAYTALILYQKYLDLQKNGTLEHVLDRIYSEGRALNYRVPL
ncbi:hypothetical protein HG536_0D03850 [Torulaspora globosa]|uniref:Exonuclease domain-containing protein n=1 Tax=Torulaspora globosa TaxID=48254 RepID=A0A7G3ZH77_9SACH|nr:uncharacterized protein HG536_0D03850 [Torulaspora globosa]QLL32863.1 hypothetical protein HG536_0D03850 [Torulaspora globosa]